MVAFGSGCRVASRYLDEMRSLFLSWQPWWHSLIDIDIDIDIQAYFKPCTGNPSREDSRAEFLAMLLDRFMGFYRTPVVVPYEISAATLLRLARDFEVSSESMKLLDDDHSLIEGRVNQSTDNDDEQRSNVIADVLSIIDQCGAKSSRESPSNDLVAGVLVGWLNFPLRYEEHRGELRDADYPARLGKRIRSDVEHAERVFPQLSLARSSPQDVRWGLETVALNLFGALTNYMNRFNHNVFVYRDALDTLDGPYVYLDNDRAKFGEPAFNNASDPKHELAYANNRMLRYCKFPASIAERLLVLRPDDRSTHDQLATLLSEDELSITPLHRFTLGELMLDTIEARYRPLHWAADTINRSWFTSHNASVADRNVEHWARAIDICLSMPQARDRASVLLREPWLRAWEDEYMSLSLKTRRPLQSTTNDKDAASLTALNSELTSSPHYRFLNRWQQAVHSDFVVGTLQPPVDENLAAELHRAIEFQINLFKERWSDRMAMAKQWYDHVALVSQGWPHTRFPDDGTEHIRLEVRFDTAHCPVPTHKMRLRNYVRGPRAGLSSLDWKMSSYAGNWSNVVHVDMRPSLDQRQLAFQKLEQGTKPIAVERALALAHFSRQTFIRRESDTRKEQRSTTFPSDRATRIAPI